MRLFKCQACGEMLYFENRSCTNCGRRLGYLPERALLSTVEPDGNFWRAHAVPDRRFVFCANEASDVCNWLVPADGGSALCVACSHNRTIPDLTIPENLVRWRKIEIAKHRLFYSLLQLRLPLAGRSQDGEGLAFDVLAAPPLSHANSVLIGHDSGQQTGRHLLARGDHGVIFGVGLGKALCCAPGGVGPGDELVGLARHGGNHHSHLMPRALFGDDSADYAAALQAHYEHGPAADWGENFVSAYASTHPWEDFAETWAHYFHIVDTIEVASAFGMQLHPRIDATGDLGAVLDYDPYRSDMAKLLESWKPLTFALNNLNRSMGHGDLYPFILSPKVMEKLGFIHELIHYPRG